MLQADEAVIEIPPEVIRYCDRDDVRLFINEMVAQQKFNRAELMRLFRDAVRVDSVLESIAKPAERKLTWEEYRAIFIDEKRVQAGADFWHAHAEMLQKVSQEYGVPPEIILAILAVETRYGNYTGRHRVLDSLITLAFDGKSRQSFFREELKAFLLLAREEHLDPRLIKGSYAGAMGMPQFISSSYRQYAVDYDGDGQRDLWNSDADILASVANYFKKHGWAMNQPVVLQALSATDAAAEIAVGRGRVGLKPEKTLAELRALGVEWDKKAQTASDKTLATLMVLDKKDGTLEYWLGLQNFYVITRYNHSSMYAMAAYQLSQLIKARAEVSKDFNMRGNTSSSGNKR
ncbi:MAG: lytic murein transglycosylase B [Gammaproteobacteria bacterium]|nr:lytic murein transglycosylase B [Gammaproteobacteria bacterium]